MEDPCGGELRCPGIPVPHAPCEATGKGGFCFWEHGGSVRWRAALPRGSSPPAPTAKPPQGGFCFWEAWRIREVAICAAQGFQSPAPAAKPPVKVAFALE